MKPRQLLITTLTLLLTLSFIPSPASAMDVGPFKLTGYVRSYLSWNMEDVAEIATDDSWKLSMNRQTLFLEAFGKVGPTRWTGRLRADQEFITDYEDRLQASSNATCAFLGCGLVDLADEYDGLDMRELFVDFSIGKRLDFRLGRQQVVWGETDFFHATDVIHGYDFRWRHFLVPENEDVRKPLILANVTLDVPELKGSLQGIVRPGLDREEWIGNSVPIFGGRWHNRSGKGGVFGGYTAPPYFVKTSWSHPTGDRDNPHYGFRWTGVVGKNDDIDYSLMYYHGTGGFMSDPILIATPPNNGSVAPVAFGGAFGLELIYPETNTYGGTVSGYMPFIDSTYRLEAAWTNNRRFSNTTTFSMVTKDAWNFLAGIDANPRLQKYIGTSSQSLLTLQVFDWYLNADQEQDRILNFVGAGSFDDHNMMGTMILTLPYMNDTLIGTFVGIVDLTHGGGLVIPSLEKHFGPHWRVKLEADISLGGNITKANGGFPGDDASILGIFDKNSQLLLRTTYQF